jgi:CRP-like cAMP-binding protein
MVSPELLLRYPFFAGLSHDEVAILAKRADDTRVEAGHRFFRDGEPLTSFFLVVEGQVGIVVELPDKEQTHRVSGQLTGELATADVTVATLGPGDVFGWSALISPTEATAGAKALKDARIVEIDCTDFDDLFREDWHFGYMMTRKVANVIRGRLKATRIEALECMKD